MKQRIRLTESQLNRVIRESVKRVLKETAGGESWYGMTITYHGGMSTGGARDVNSVKELTALAQQEIEKDPSIESIELYRVDCDGTSSMGKHTILKTLKGENQYRDPWEDPEFRQWYLQQWREQD